jgi:hypothetical protein
MKTAAGIFVFFILLTPICNAQQYHGDYWDFFAYYQPSTSSEGTGKIYLNSNNDAFSSWYNPALPSFSDKLRISYSTSQNASFVRNDYFPQHENAFYNAFGIDVPVKNVGTFSFVSNFNNIKAFVENNGEYEWKNTAYNINYSRNILNGLNAGAGLNYFKWEGMYPSNFHPDRFFSEYYSFNLGISYNYSLPASENYTQSAFIDLSILNILNSHPNTKNDFGTSWNLPQIDHISLGYLSKYKGFGIIEGVDDFQTDVQIENVDLLNSYYYNTFSVGMEIKFIDIVSLKVGNYYFIEDYTTYGFGLSFPLKLISQIPLVIGVDYSHLKVPPYYYPGNNDVNSFSANLRYDIN